MDFIKLIKEGRKEDFVSKYSNKYSPEQIKRVLTMVQPKFYDWVGKNLDVINFDENFTKLYPALEFFEKNSGNLVEPDLYQYKSVQDLFNAISEFQKKQRRIVKKVKGGNVVYDGDRFFVVNPLTHDASCYYGQGTKWCTSSKSDTHFNTYNDEGKLFYVIDKTLPTSDPLYKVAILKKYNEEKSYWDAKDDSFKTGWIIGTEELKEIESAIDQYMEDQFAERLKIFRDQEAAHKERQRLNRLRIERERNRKLAEAEERRIENEWELGPNCPEIGVKANALFNYLVSEGEIIPKTNEDRERIDQLTNQIEQLQLQYDQSEEVETDLLDQISELEDEVETLEGKYDVYNLIPDGSHYRMDAFELIPSDVEDQRWAVGTEGEVQTSCEEYVEQLLDDVGYDGFSRGFVEGYLDADAVAEYAEDFYGDDVENNPEVYFDESERQLSDEQNETIGVNKDKIQSLEQIIENLEESKDGENDDELQDKIDEIQETIDELNDEISDIEADPEGEYPQDLIDEKVEELVEDVRRNPRWFMDEFGLQPNEYIDKDAFIEGLIDTDGYGIINGWDGSYSDIRVGDEYFIVMRID